MFELVICTRHLGHIIISSLFALIFIFLYNLHSHSFVFLGPNIFSQNNPFLIGLSVL